MFKKFLLLICCVFLLLSLYCVSNAQAIEMNNNFENMESIKKEDTHKKDFEPNNIDYQKLHFYVVDGYETIEDKQHLITAVNNLVEDYGFSEENRTRNSENTINVTVSFVSDFFETSEYIDFEKSRANCKSMAEVRALREQHNAFSKIYHEELINSHVDVLSVLEYTDIEYVDYSPYVILEMDVNNLTAESLETLCEYSYVESISLDVSLESVSEASWEETLDIINATTIVNNETFTGQNVRIGVYESGGVCDITSNALVDKNITLKNPLAQTRLHATQVTTILALLAPNAE